MVPLAVLKGIIYTISLYLLYLCCSPCADVCISAAEQQMVAQSSGGHTDCPVGDACTPFCLDGCCVAHVIPGGADSSPIGKIEFNSGDPNFYFAERTFPEITIAIWQPPKV